MTALAATYQAGTALLPPRVLLQVTAAPSLTASYVSNFAASVDGWTGPGGSTLTFNQSPNTALRLQGAAGVTTTFSRTVTGLTIGQTYRYSLMANQTAGSSVTLSVTGKVGGTIARPSPRSAMAYSFVATATSHVLTITINPGKTPVGSPGVVADVLVDTVVVIRSSGWQGTTIRRTDANGTSVVVRENDGGQDAVGTSGSATMTVTDYEAALTGPVSYTVTDGNGGTATANLAAPSAPGLSLTLPATSAPGVPVAPTYAQVDRLTRYSETSPSRSTVHEVINRADPIVNPGPLGYRSGVFVIWAKDFATARQVRAMLALGLTAHLRQPDFPGLDLYFTVVGDVTIEHEDEDTSPRRWSVTIAYQEVAAP